MFKVTQKAVSRYGQVHTWRLIRPRYNTLTTLGGCIALGIIRNIFQVTTMQPYPLDVQRVREDDLKMHKYHDTLITAGDYQKVGTSEIRPQICC